MKILVTGVAGFIGAHTAMALLSKGHFVVGIDNLNDYYDVSLKRDRLSQIKSENFEFYKYDLTDHNIINGLFSEKQFDIVINLAAQAGVRYSIENPRAYVDSNIVGFVNILEACRHNNIKHLIYASSSSVYGMNEKLAFSEDDNVDHPVSLYAATKKSNELLAHTYSHLYGLSTTGLRFFTVYGPWGRPDMAYYSFTKAILSNKTIKVFNNGHMLRDFTYIDDIVESVTRLVDVPATSSSDWNSSSPVPSKSSAPYKVYNIGNNNPVKLGKFIETLEGCLGMDAIKEYLPMQMGDVKATYADIASLEDVVDFKPSTSLRDGLDKFTSWYLEYTKS